VVRLGSLAVLLLRLVLAVGLLDAGNNTTAVSGTVTSQCTVTGTTFGFGSYDPVVTNKSSALNATVTTAVSISCTRGTTGVYLTADTGSNGGQGGCSTTRAMKSGTHYLCYDLYTNSPGGTVWNTTNSGGHTISYSPVNTMGSVNQTVYGQIPAGQDAVTGSYSDSVTVTVFP